MIHAMYYILKTHSTTEFWLRPYDIIALSPDSGLIECIPDTVSLDALRRSDKRYISLLNFFEKFYGKRLTFEFYEAQDNFIVSLATYSIICYLLSIKDRHNGNILLDNMGHIIHIDFGFILGKST